MIPLARRLSERWNQFWFTPDSATNLATIRIVVALHALWHVLSRDYAAISGLPQEFWRGVSSSARWRYLLFEGNPYPETIIQWVATAALVGALVGVYPRLSCFVAGIALYHLGPLETIIWTPAPLARGLTIAPIALLALSASPAGDALSLWPRRQPEAGRSLSGKYRWPRALVQLLVCQIYLFAAYGKLVETGWAWGSAENIRLWLLWFNLEEQNAVFHTLGLWIADRPALCAAIGAGSLALEWTFILALFWRRARPWLISMAVVFHIGILLTMNIHVGETWLLLVFIDWDALAQRVRDRLGGGGKPHVPARVPSPSGVGIQ